MNTLDDWAEIILAPTTDNKTKQELQSKLSAQIAVEQIAVQRLHEALPVIVRHGITRARHDNMSYLLVNFRQFRYTFEVTHDGFKYFLTLGEEADHAITEGLSTLSLTASAHNIAMWIVFVVYNLHK